jgi:hypothetical protein
MNNSTSFKLFSLEVDPLRAIHRLPWRKFAVFHKLETLFSRFRI